ncbi:hypothetical protein K438DRAFT_1784989 [Mycena galopus ATCC 62051]|nr:hypothetical protein K438DRAFT_1784989 [Mycena galopus ATCC 62051]
MIPYSPEFEDLLKVHDLVILQETWLLPDDEECPAIPHGFYAISVCRKATGPVERHGGGVTAFIKNNIHAKKSHLSSPDILVHTSSPIVHIGSIYTDSAPEHKLDETLSLCAAADDTKPIILLLDGNARTKSEQAGGDLARLSANSKSVTP